MPTIDATTVYAAARVETEAAADARYCCYRLDGCLNKRFRVAVGLQSEFYSVKLEGWHRLSWTYDLDNGPWQHFEETVDEGEYWVGENYAPFEQDTIYVCNLPVFPLARLDAAVDAWIASPLTNPTPSGDASYVIGTLPAAIGKYSKTLPEVQLRAFTVGTGSKKVAATIGIHPDELSLWFSPGMMATLLGDSAESISLRDNYTFYIYPYMNPQGLYGGYTRIDPIDGTDANRFWNTDTSPLRAAYKTAWATDLAGLTVHIDCHSAPFAGPEEIPREIRFSPLSTTIRDAYITAFEARSSLQVVNSIVTDSCRDYVNSNFSPQLGMAAEHSHAVREDAPEWSKYGSDLVASLADIANQFT